MHQPDGTGGPLIDAADEIVTRAEREIEALVAVSSPSGDLAGAEEAIARARDESAEELRLYELRHAEAVSQAEPSPAVST